MNEWYRFSVRCRANPASEFDNNSRTRRIMSHIYASTRSGVGISLTVFRCGRAPAQYHQRSSKGNISCRLLELFCAMDSHTDIDLMRGDTSQNSLVESFTVDHEHDPGNTALNEDSDNIGLPSSNVHLSIVTDGSDIEAHEGQSPIHPFKPDQEPSDIKTERNTIDHEQDCTYPQSNSDQVILPKEVSPSECLVDPASGMVNIDDAEAPTIDYHQASPLLRARTVSPATSPPDEREADPDEGLNSIQTLHTGLDNVQTDGLAHLTDEGNTGEDFDYPCEDFLPSLPPSSSPPHVLSSSPYASSQSSVGDVEPSKTV
ncbi:hypothetical protein OG21DRAFT_983151 [Imleria badia]|nr:hypothetical protein OG21DRAFT_983151 [Imleria badia]